MWNEQETKAVDECIIKKYQIMMLPSKKRFLY